MNHAPSRLRRRCLHAVLPLLIGALLFSGCRTLDRTGAEIVPGRPAPRPMPPAVHAIWVARFHYQYPDDVRTIIANCAALGCNTVLWQVRGEATVSYPSHVEPWSREYNFADPGFDPLAVAVEAAHKHGLRIEAWMNVMPGWNGSKPPPPNLAHVYNDHPDWFIRDAAGQPQPLNDHYVILNPANPEVRRHITSVVGEFMGRYALDGVHLDYVRYAWDTTPNASQKYPRDAQTLKLYRQQTGHGPDDDRQAWNHWRANQLTRLVDEVRQTVERVRPGATVTAAVWNDPTVGYREYLQNAVVWLRTGLIDAAYPMAYTNDAGKLAAYIDAYQRGAPGRRIIPGLGVYMFGEPAEFEAQLARCAARGGHFALFSYASFFPTAGDRTLARRAHPRDPSAAAARKAAPAREEWERKQREWQTHQATLLGFLRR